MGPRRCWHTLAPIVVDAGPLYAYVDADDKHHAACATLLESHPGPFIVPALVVAEAAYLIAVRLGPDAEVRFLGDFANGAFAVQPIHPSDWLRMADLVSTYRDLPLGTADASVLACAERLRITDIATTDRRHFTVVRPRHTRALNLLP
nr:PIN domain-containing protein [Nonomuraea typhae]